MTMVAVTVSGSKASGQQGLLMAGSASKPDDVTEWLQQLRSPNATVRATASQKLFDRYVEKLQREVRIQVSSKLRAEVDSNLVAAKALQSFLECPSSSITNRNSLLNWLMHAVAWRRKDAIRKAKAKRRFHPGKMSLEHASGGADVDDGGIYALDGKFVALPVSEPEIKRRKEHPNAPGANYEKGDSAFASMDGAHLILLDVDSGDAEMLIEMVGKLPKEFAEIAALAIQGDTVTEIARKLSYSVRSIQLSLRNMHEHLRTILFDAPPSSNESSNADGANDGTGA